MISPTIFQVSSGKGTTLDFCRRFAEKEKSNFLKPFGNKKIVTETGHKFQGYQCSSTTKCSVCNRPLWGIGIQGYQCQCKSSFVTFYFFQVWGGRIFNLLYGSLILLLVIDEVLDIWCWRPPRRLPGLFKLVWKCWKLPSLVLFRSETLVSGIAWKDHFSDFQSVFPNRCHLWDIGP